MLEILCRTVDKDKGYDITARTGKPDLDKPRNSWLRRVYRSNYPVRAGMVRPSSPWMVTSLEKLWTKLCTKLMHKKYTQDKERTHQDKTTLTPDTTNARQDSTKTNARQDYACDAKNGLFKSMQDQTRQNNTNTRQDKIRQDKTTTSHDKSWQDKTRQAKLRQG